jgi:hypothetical protein
MLDQPEGSPRQPDERDEDERNDESLGQQALCRATRHSYSSRDEQAPRLACGR